MKLIAERAHLAAALKAVAHLADGKSKIPALGHVRLVAKGGRLAIAATDLDCWAEADIPAEIETDGAVALPAPQLARMVQGFADGSQVYIDFAGPQATVKAGRSRYQLPTWPAGDFPVAFEAGDIAARFELHPDEVKRLFDLPRPAASKGMADRAYLEGVFLHAAPNANPPRMVGVAASGYTLLAADVPLPEGGEALPVDRHGRPSLMVPLSAVEHLVKLGDSGLEVEAGANVITVRALGILNVRYSSKLIENSFPEYERFVPPCEGPHIAVEGGAFAEAVKRLSAMAGDDKRGVALEWGESGDLALWLDSAADSIDGTEMVEVAFRGGGPARVGLQCSLLAKAIDAVGRGRLEIFSTPGKNVRFRNVDDASLIVCAAPLALKRAA
jgi:DNA polymerase-3 subunit beta